MRKIVGKPKRVSIIFTEEIIKGYDLLEKETGASFSELIRRAAIHFLEKMSFGKKKNEQ